MTVKYRYSADEGKEVPIETEEQRLEREDREERERRDQEWKREEAEREQRRTGLYL